MNSSDDTSAFADGPTVQLEEKTDFVYPNDEPEHKPLKSQSPESHELVVKLATILHSHSRPLLTLDCLLYASGAFLPESISVRSIAREHGVTVKSVLLRAQILTDELGLRPLNIGKVKSNGRLKPRIQVMGYVSPLQHLVRHLSRIGIS